MTKKFSFILYFFSTLLIGCFLAEFVYLQYFSCTNLIAGTRISITKELIIYGFFQSAPIILYAMPLLLKIYKIRHTKNPIFSVIAYILFCLLIWIILFPLLETGTNYIKEHTTISQKLEQHQPITGGYFRKIKTNLYYTINDSIEGNVDTLLINNSQNPNFQAEYKKLDVSEQSEFKKQAFPFKDSCIKESIPLNSLGFLRYTTQFLTRAQFAWKNGYISWLCFCSFGLALAASYSFIKKSQWRLNNLLIILFSDCFIVLLNLIYYSTRFEKNRVLLNNLFYANGKLDFLATRNIDLPIMIVNLIFSLCIIVIGCILTHIGNKNLED